ncbi:hypothetical protein CFP56_001896 [Quercus suber]|uniref:Uncharacterized protein n=1 Tax=Quercus suber TaxID=58331 RepID=A0AAW0IKW5_QUESU
MTKGTERRRLMWLSLTPSV